MEICRHFGECGGCKFQDIEYPAQLLTKHNEIKNLLKHPLSSKLAPIIGSDHIYFYRNKMEFSFLRHDDRISCGLHHLRHKREIINIEECNIFSKDTALILESLRRFFNDKGTSVYDRYSHKGFLRHLVLREAKNTQDFMVNLVTSSQGSFDKEELVRVLLCLSLNKRISSIIWTVNDSLSDAVVPERCSVIYGENYIEEIIQGLRFKIMPHSFFQVNPCILDTFYATLKGILNLQESHRVLDIFCGMGTISFILSGLCDFVWGIEAESYAVDNAYINASSNNIKNAAFLSGNARTVLFNNMYLWKNNIDIVVINPPRSGISKKIIQRIKEINPGKIIYSSCNPVSFMENLEWFLDSYDIDIIQPFDFFPHTPHVEVLGLLVSRHD